MVRPPEGFGVAVDVTQAFAAYLASNRGPTPTDPDAREPPDYGFAATFDGAVIELVLTFRAGSAYCCGEWQCHFMLFPTRRWDRLRRELSALRVEIAGRLELVVEVVIEEGALFLLPRRSKEAPAGLAPAKAFRYRQVITEGDRPEAEPIHGHP
jgi:hypothetical protein